MESPPMKKTELKKAEVSDRVIAFIIDGAVAFIFGFVPIVGWIAGFIYGLVKDAMVAGPLEGRSVGKHLMNLKVVDPENGEDIDYGKSALRNVVWAIPLVNLIMLFVELYLAATDEKGMRVGDKIAKTMVVSTK